MKLSHDGRFVDESSGIAASPSRSRRHFCSALQPPLRRRALTIRLRKTICSTPRSGCSVQSNTRRTRRHLRCSRKSRLDEALADKTWTAATEQTGDFSGPAAGGDPRCRRDGRSTIPPMKPGSSRRIPTSIRRTGRSGSMRPRRRPFRAPLEFTKYADSKGVKVFYVTNRTKEEEEGDAQEHGGARLPDGRQCRHAC